MVYKRFQAVAQVVGIVTIGLLAVYGLVAILGGDLVAWASGHAAPTVASAPSVMNYQGYLQDDSGDPLDGAYTMTFRIYDIVTATTALWEEQHTDVTVREGHFSVLLGYSAPLNSSLFSTPERYLGVKVEPYDEMVPRQRFASVPYAFHADRANGLSASDGDPLDSVVVDEDGNVGIGMTEPDTLVTVGDGTNQDLMKFNTERGWKFTASGSDWQTTLDLQSLEPTKFFRVVSKNGTKMPLQVMASDDVDFSAVYLVEDGGQVGIGTTATSSSTLHVEGQDNNGTTAALKISTSESNQHMLLDGNAIDVSSDDNKLHLNPFSDGPVTVGGGGLVVNGNVGIGTANPQSKLDVNGDANVNGTLTVNSTAPISITRFENIGEGGGTTGINTHVYSHTHYCVATGWSAKFDIDENGPGTYVVWTYANPDTGTWWVWVNFPNHGGELEDKENPDVDVICFRREIAAWGGAVTTLKDPD